MTTPTLGNAVVAYFGKDTITAFSTDYFKKHGNTEETKQHLMAIATLETDTFTEMLCDYLDKKNWIEV